MRHRGPVPEGVIHALTRVQSESARMSVLVDDLLLLARLDAGRPLEAEPVDLSRLAIDVTSDARVGVGHAGRQRYLARVQRQFGHLGRRGGHPAQRPQGELHQAGAQDHGQPERHREQHVLGVLHLLELGVHRGQRQPGDQHGVVRPRHLGKHELDAERGQRPGVGLRPRLGTGRRRRTCTGGRQTDQRGRIRRGQRARVGHVVIGLDLPAGGQHRQERTVRLSLGGAVHPVARIRLVAVRPAARIVAVAGGGVDLARAGKPRTALGLDLGAERGHQRVAERLGRDHADHHAGQPEQDHQPDDQLAADGPVGQHARPPCQPAVGPHRTGGH
ncbi:MAG: hypothetical protein ACRDPD_04430 [Streptosporangiaceae bacterium]